MQTTPFKRAQLMVAAIAGLMASMKGSELISAMQSIGEYRSRGHGRGAPTRKYNYATPWKEKLMRNYDTYCGERECLRRIRRGKVNG